MILVLLGLCPSSDVMLMIMRSVVFFVQLYSYGSETMQIVECVNYDVMFASERMYVFLLKS